MVADHFVNNEAQEFLCKVRIKLGIAGQLPQPFNLLLLPRRISWWQRRPCLKFAHGLRYLETLCEHEN